jgi:hypothetical protein
MDHGKAHLEGKTDDVVSKYLAAMVTRGRKEVMEEEAIGKPLPVLGTLDISDEATARIPRFLAHVPNIDHRYGNGKAHVAGIGILGMKGIQSVAWPRAIAFVYAFPWSFERTCLNRT